LRFMKLAGIILFICFCAFVAAMAPSCANIVPPSGGPRDSLPPKLLKASPENGTTNFRGKNIVLQFDEFVDMAELQKNLLFMPTFNAEPRIEVRLRTVTLTIKDSLEPNTTYSFNFGDAIRDINEGNVLHNFTYRFSTGAVLDTLKLEGKVILAETGKIDSTLSVFLYRNQNDSAVMKERPRYITRLDRDGHFSFENLPAGSYSIYALKDASGTKRYLDKSQLFAFADSPVVVKADTKPVTLLAYSELPPKGITPIKPPASSDRRLRISTNIAGSEQDLLRNLELNFERPLKKFDSGLLKLTADSLFKPVVTSIKLDSTRRKITIQTAWQAGAGYHLIADKEFAEDSTGRKLFKTDTIHFVAKKTTDYGTLSIRLRNVDLKADPVLQFVQNNEIVFSTPVNSGVFTSSLFLPGDYELRVLYDANRNGKWDPGSFFKGRKQPEIVKPIDRRITVKPNWDNEFEIAL
jgi:uncharacterized protein (DUF2141 family)